MLLVWLILFCLTFTSLGSFSQEKKLNSDNVIWRTSFIIVLRAWTLFSSFNYGFLQHRIHGPCWRTLPMQQSTMFNTSSTSYKPPSFLLQHLPMLLKHFQWGTYFILTNFLFFLNILCIVSVATSSMSTANTPTWVPPHLRHGKRSHITVCRRWLFSTSRTHFKPAPPISTHHDFWHLKTCFWPLRINSAYIKLVSDFFNPVLPKYVALYSHY